MTSIFLIASLGVNLLLTIMIFVVWVRQRDDDKWN